MLDEGHETAASTVVDGYLDDVLHMPDDSPWPPLLALCVLGVFAMLLGSHYVIAGCFAGGALLTLGAWQADEPEGA